MRFSARLHHVTAALTTDDYRRCARACGGCIATIRWRLRDRCALAQSHDRAAAAPSPAPASTAFDGGRHRSFASMVAAKAAVPTLRYSERLRLLREAQRLGVRRFDANLIIAAVQERRSFGAGAQERVRRRGGWIATAAVFGFVQSAILAGVGYLLVF